MKAASVISESQQRGIQEAHARSPLINVALIGLHVCLQQSSKKRHRLEDYSNNLFSSKKMWKVAICLLLRWELN